MPEQTTFDLSLAIASELERLKIGVNHDLYSGLIVEEVEDSSNDEPLVRIYDENASKVYNAELLLNHLIYLQEVDLSQIRDQIKPFERSPQDI